MVQDVNPSGIGAVAEAEVAHALLRAGRDVYVPLFKPHARVDLVVGGPGGLLRVQCKTSRCHGGALVFRTCSNTGNVAQDYRGEIDAFGVWSPELEQAFLVPVTDVALRGSHLRLRPPANGQARGIRWAADYVVAATTSGDDVS